MGLKEMGMGLDWIDVTKNGKWQAFAHTVMNFGFHKTWDILDDLSN